MKFKIIEAYSLDRFWAPPQGVMIGARNLPPVGNGPDGHYQKCTFWLVPKKMPLKKYMDLQDRQCARVSLKIVPKEKIAQFLLPPGYSYGGRRNFTKPSDLSRFFPQCLPFLRHAPKNLLSYSPNEIYLACFSAIV